MRKGPIQNTLPVWHPVWSSLHSIQTTAQMVSTDNAAVPISGLQLVSVLSTCDNGNGAYTLNWSGPLQVTTVDVWTDFPFTETQWEYKATFEAFRAQNINLDTSNSQTLMKTWSHANISSHPRRSTCLYLLEKQTMIIKTIIFHFKLWLHPKWRTGNSFH